jgi:hypothetical protein
MLLATVVSAALLSACATPVGAIKDQVRMQATGDLVCDHASISVVQLRALKKVQGQKQTIERGSFSAKGCGGYATYAVECVRGACMVEREVDETLDVNKKKKPADSVDSESGTP